ncbi:MFS transporter [Kitasatospora sp. NE20-6]|uniref:MFS transporter n=1 Tax=Kitasatospora sp. NE20-6 TaxID=2859066 RepID=UPI0034DBBAA4
MTGDRADRTRRRWLMLAVGTGGQTAMTTALYGLPYLVPAFRQRFGVSLAGAGILVSGPILGVMVTMIAWGVVADRRGERAALAAGLLPAAALLAAAAAAPQVHLLAVLLVLVGAFGAAVNASSGRLVIGWFPPHRRGVAMGVRQAAQPLGVGLAAAVLPPLARHAGLPAALGFCAALCALAGLAVLLLAADPPRPAGAGPVPWPGPYRGGRLWRLHGAAALLAVPQFVVTGFALVFLVGARGWSVAGAGTVLAAANLAGAAVRLLAGWWSDTVGSRVRPMRLLALLTAADVLLLAAGALWPSPLGTAALLLASGLTVSTNGLHNTAVAESAGPAWAGRALGAHGVGQHAAVVLVPPLAGALITAQGFAPAFALAAAFPLVAAAVIPGEPGGPPAAGYPGPAAGPGAAAAGEASAS